MAKKAQKRQHSHRETELTTPSRNVTLKAQGRPVPTLMVLNIPDKPARNGEKYPELNHPGCEITPCFIVGFRNRRSPPVSFLRTFPSVISMSGYARKHQRGTVCAA